MAATLTATTAQASFDASLRDLFQKQFSRQQGVLDYLSSVAKPIVERSLAGQGFSPDALAALRTSATEGITDEFEHARAALNERLKTSGDQNVPSGVNAGLETDLLNQEAQAKASAQRGITIGSAQLANSNLFQALDVMSGNASQINPLGYASEATGGSGAIAGLSKSQSALQDAVTNANNASFFGKITTGIATGIGNIPFGIHK